MEHDLVIDGGYRKNPPVRALSPLIAVNGLDSKLIMYDKVTLQNNYNECAAPDPSLYQNGAGVFIRTFEGAQERQAEFILKGGTIRGNVNNTQNHVPCGGGVFIAGFGLFTMEGGVIAGNTAYRSGGGFHTGSRGSFRKTGGIIYGYNAPKELQNRVINGDGKPPFYGYAVAVPPSLIYHGSDTTVTEDRVLTYTGAEIGQPVVFGENETWGIDIYHPPTSGPSIMFIIALSATGILLAAAIVLLVILVLRKRKGAVEPAGTDSRMTGMVKDAPIPAETERPEAEKLPDLSPREKEIFTLLLTDVPRKEIAHVLKISISAVNFHAKNLYHKLGIQSRVELFTKFGKK
jgi:DNA-binding CsgD family transcriptional regulator